MGDERASLAQTVSEGRKKNPSEERVGGRVQRGRAKAQGPLDREPCTSEAWRGWRPGPGSALVLTSSAVVDKFSVPWNVSVSA